MTKKYVLTGGPCCGKTTLLHELEMLGHSVLSEVARGVIEQRVDQPLNYQESLIRQELIFNRQVEMEEKLGGDHAFLDRGIFDNFAYQQHLLGHLIPEYIDLSLNHPRYDEIFVLNRLVFQNDGLRIEKDDNEAEKLHNLIIDSYKSFGYNPVFVPVFDNPQKRAEFVLNYLGEKK